MDQYAGPTGSRCHSYTALVASFINFLHYCSPSSGFPFLVLWRCWLGDRKGIRTVKKTEWWAAGVVICLERDADLHMAQLMPLPLTVSCFSKIQIGFTFLVLAYPGSPGKVPLNGCVRVCVCVCVCEVR